MSWLKACRSNTRSPWWGIQDLSGVGIIPLLSLINCHLLSFSPACQENSALQGHSLYCPSYDVLCIWQPGQWLMQQAHSPSKAAEWPPPCSIVTPPTFLPRFYCKGPNSMGIFQTLIFPTPTQRVRHKASMKFMSLGSCWCYVCLTLPEYHLSEGKDWVLSHFPFTMLVIWPNRRSGGHRYSALYPFPEDPLPKHPLGAWIYSLVLPTPNENIEGIVQCQVDQFILSTI